MLANTKFPTDEALAVSNGVEVTVTGVDVQGQMFRHSATVLLLDGRDCAFRSKSQPELDGSVLCEFDYPQADPQRRISQGRVKSNQADLVSGLYTVVVELEIAQTAKVFPNQIESQTAVKKRPLPSPPAASEPKGKPEPIIAPALFPALPKSNSLVQSLPRLNGENGAAVKVESREVHPMAQAEDPSRVRDEVRLAVASEIKQQTQLLKTWLSSELQQTVPAIVSSNMEKMIGEVVDKKISVNSEASIEALSIDLVRQVGDRLAGSEDLRIALENMAKKLFEEQTGLSRSAGAKIEQELSSRAATIVRSFEGSIAEAEARLKAAHADMEATLTKAQALKQKIVDDMLPIQESLEQLNKAERAGIEKLQMQAAAQLSKGAEQFENQLEKISTERVGQFAMEMERQIAPHRQRADETMGKVGAGLQLIQGTVRVQQERLTEHARTTAASFDKEIRSLLLRLAGGGKD